MLISRRASSTPFARLIQRAAPLLFYVALSFALIWADRHQTYSGLLQHSLQRLAEPIRLALEWPLQGLVQTQVWLQQQHQLSSELTQVQRQQASLMAALQLREGVLAENQALRQQLGLPDLNQWRTQTVVVSALAAPTQGHSLRVRFDPRHAMQRGQPVIDAYGVLGQLERVRGRSADVTLITDPDHALPVRVARTGELTLAHGGGQRADLRLRELPMNIDLQIGDQLLTSGLDEVFPPGLPVAVISEVTRPPGQAFAAARAELLARPHQAQFVTVLLPITGPPSPMPRLDDE